jgi:hypothetical protein
MCSSRGARPLRLPVAAGRSCLTAWPGSDRGGALVFVRSCRPFDGQCGRDHQDERLQVPVTHRSPRSSTNVRGSECLHAGHDRARQIRHASLARSSGSQFTWMTTVRQKRTPAGCLVHSTSQYAAQDCRLNWLRLWHPEEDGDLTGPLTERYEKATWARGDPCGGPIRANAVEKAMNGLAEEVRPEQEKPPSPPASVIALP